MPFVEVFVRQTMSEKEARELKHLVRQFGPDFEPADFKLYAQHFSFKFHNTHPYDSLEHDVLLRIILRDTPKQWSHRPASPGQIAKEQALRIAEQVSELAPPIYLRVMVELRLDPMSFIGSASFNPAEHRYSIVPKQPEA